LPIVRQKPFFSERKKLSASNRHKDIVTASGIFYRRAIVGRGFSSKDDISKEIPTKPGSGLIFKDLLLQSYGRIFGY